MDTGDSISMGIAYSDLLLEAGILVNNAVSVEEISNILVEYANSGLKPDLLCLYQYENTLNSDMQLVSKRGFTPAPEYLLHDSELFCFLLELQQLVCLNTPKKSPFEDILLSDQMGSGLAIAINIAEIKMSVLIINSKHSFYFKRNEIKYLEDLCSIIKKTKTKAGVNSEVF